MNAQPQALNVISLAGVSKRYGNVDVLRDLDLTVQRGAIHGLVGLNGSGKTTTLECILGLQQMQSGSASILGFEPSDLYRAKGDVVAVFDTPSLHANLTVRQALSHAAHLIPAQKKPSASGVQPPRSVDEVMLLLGLSRYESFKIRSLSLGNRRRASIAHALLGNPKLVLLDEPFNGLDAGGVDEVLALIKPSIEILALAFYCRAISCPICNRFAPIFRYCMAGRLSRAALSRNCFKAATQRSS
jgi:ABC-2 type transport system ATP-binding protein